LALDATKVMNGDSSVLNRDIGQLLKTFHKINSKKMVFPTLRKNHLLLLLNSLREWFAALTVNIRPSLAEPIQNIVFQLGQNRTSSFYRQSPFLCLEHSCYLQW